MSLGRKSLHFTSLVLYLVMGCTTTSSQVSGESKSSIDDSSSKRASTGVKIEAWTRRAGNYANGERHDKRAPQLLNLKDFTEETIVKRMVDFQTGRKTFYKAIPLEKLVAAYQPMYDHDLVLLHFSNKVIIPLPADANDPTYRELKATIAFETSEDGKKWSRKFLPVERVDEIAFRGDPTPITFTNNKMVVSGTPYPRSPGLKFSPWRHAASLEGLEFVNSEAYYRQFEVSSEPAVLEGLEVYKERCQYCHSVRQVGAGYGWDYVAPLPTYKQRKKETLFTHIRFEKVDKMAVTMPSQTDFTQKEAEKMWQWLKAVGTKPLKAYQP